MFPQLFMLGDVDVDWDLPAGHLVPAEPEEVTVSRERAALFKKWLGA